MLAPSWFQLGSSWSHVGPIWGSPATPGPTETRSDPFPAASWPPKPLLDSKWVPKGPPKHPTWTLKAIKRYPFFTPSWPSGNMAIHYKKDMPVTHPVDKYTYQCKRVHTCIFTYTHVFVLQICFRWYSSAFRLFASGRTTISEPTLLLSDMCEIKVCKISLSSTTCTKTSTSS